MPSVDDCLDRFYTDLVPAEDVQRMRVRPGLRMDTLGPGTPWDLAQGWHNHGIAFLGIAGRMLSSMLVTHDLGALNEIEPVPHRVAAVALSASALRHRYGLNKLRFITTGSVPVSPQLEAYMGVLLKPC